MTLEPNMDSNMTPNRPGSIENPVLSRHSRKRKEKSVDTVAETKVKRLTVLQSVRAKCLDYSNGSALEVRLCPVKTCTLFEYRFGTNPARKGIGPRHPAFKRKQGADHVA